MPESINAALLEVQKELPTPKLDSVNPHFHNKYASLQELLRCVVPALNSHGLWISQQINVIDPTDGKGCYQTLSTWVYAANDSKCLSVMILPTSDNPQSTGSALTYYKRQQLQAAFGICGEDDEDGEIASHGQTDIRSAKRPQKPPQKPTGAKSEHSKAKDALWKTIQSRADNDGTTPNEVTKTVDSHAHEKFGHPLSECGDTEMLLLDAWLRGEVSDVSTD